MKQGIDYISNLSYRFVVILGLLVGFVSLTLTTPVVPQVQITASESGNNNDQQSDQQPELKVGAFDAITSSVHINFHQDFQLNYILPDLDDDSEETSSTDQVILPGSKALKILFRRIISPNAP